MKTVKLSKEKSDGLGQRYLSRMVQEVPLEE